MKVRFDDVRINEVESAEGTCCVLRSKDRVSKCESCRLSDYYFSIVTDRLHVWGAVAARFRRQQQNLPTVMEPSSAQTQTEPDCCQRSFTPNTGSGVIELQTKLREV